MAGVPGMNADLMLRWMSETGSGSIRDLRSRLEWLARTFDLIVGAATTGRWLRDLSGLGYAEADWTHDRWAVAPTVVTRLPGPDGFALITGARTAATEQRVNELDIEVFRLAQPRTGGDLARPTSILLQYDDPQDLPGVASRLGAQYVPCAARQLAALLPPLRLGAPAAAPSRFNATLERFVPETLGWESAPAAAGPAEGLYRLENMSRPQHLFWTAESGWRHCELPAGVFEQLRRRGISVMRWRPDPEPGRDGQGSVYSDWGAPLPPLHQRALVLSTGWTPRFAAGARTAIYENVPRPVAEQVAASLGQQLQPA
jgi:hypothetical protein